MGCLGWDGAEACDIRLLVKNSSPDIIVAFGFRKDAREQWSDNLLSTFVGPNDVRMVTWQGDGDYELGVRFTDAPVPIVVPVQNICIKRQVVALPNGVNVQ